MHVFIYSFVISYHLLKCTAQSKTTSWKTVKLKTQKWTCKCNQIFVEQVLEEILSKHNEDFDKQYECSTKNLFYFLLFICTLCTYIRFAASKAWWIKNKRGPFISTSTLHAVYLSIYFRVDLALIRSLQ